MVKSLVFSTHAVSRMTQRRITREQVALALRFGRVACRAGAFFHFLGERDLPRALKRQYEKLIGTTVVVNKSGEVVTVYKNRDAISTIKRKMKRFDREAGKRRFLFYLLWPLSTLLSRGLLCARIRDVSS